MRRILHIFLLLAATGLSALAQDTLSVNGRTAAGRDPLRLSAREWSPAAFLLESIPQRSWAEAGVDLRREDQAWLTQEGDAALQGFFRTENLHRFERSAVLMGASYERGVKRNVRWNETSDFTLLYPYVMADSVGGDLQREQYAFQGHYAGRSGGWTWGAGMAYRALHEYRQVDPRPRNVTSDFRVDGTAGRILGPYALALTLSYRRYHQLQNTAFVNPKGANTTLFHMTGLGSHFARFAGTNAYVNVRYRGNGYAAALLLQPLSGEGFQAGFRYGSLTTVRHLINQNEAPFTELWTQEVGTEISWIRRAGRRNWRITLDGRYEFRQGTENLLDNFVSGQFRNLLDLTMYRNRNGFVCLQGVWQAVRGADRWSLSPFVSLPFLYAEYLYPARRLDLLALEAGTDVRWEHTAGAWLLDVSGGAGWLDGMDSSLSLSEEYTDARMRSSIRSQFGKWSDNALSTRLSARVQHSLGPAMSLYMDAALQQKFYGRSGNATFLQAAVGLEF